VVDSLELTTKEVYERKKRATMMPKCSEKKLPKRVWLKKWTLLYICFNRLETKQVASTNWTENVVGHILHYWSNNSDDPI